MGESPCSLDILNLASHSLASLNLTSLNITSLNLTSLNLTSLNLLQSSLPIYESRGRGALSNLQTQKVNKYFLLLCPPPTLSQLSALDGISANGRILPSCQ